MRSTRRLVHIVGGHDFVLEPLPEVFECVLNACALKDEYILDKHLVCNRIHFQLKARATTGSFLFRCRCQLGRVGVKKIVNFLIVQLNILNLNAYAVFAVRFSSFFVHLYEELADSSRHNAFFLKTGLKACIYY